MATKHAVGLKVSKEDVNSWHDDNYGYDGVGALIKDEQAKAGSNYQLHVMH